MNRGGKKREEKERNWEEKKQHTGQREMKKSGNQEKERKRNGSFNISKPKPDPIWAPIIPNPDPRRPDYF